MQDPPVHSENLEFRLILIEPQSARILAYGASAGLVLPRATIPAQTRIAAALTDAIERRYGLRTIQLAVLSGARELSYCAVHEIFGFQEAVPGSLSFKQLDEIATGELAEKERALVLKVMRGGAVELGSFARLGWIDELFAKIGGSPNRSSWPAIRQVNQGIDFCLLSLTDIMGHKKWFKAVGEPNTREYALTLELAKRFPAYLPKILTTIPEWNGWVMEDVPGVPLNESNAIEECEQALTALAIMQKEMANDPASLLSIGAKDWTCGRIASSLEAFFREAHGAMQAQTSERSRPLGSSDLLRLENDIGSALRKLMDTGIPETLLHGDIGHGNVLATGQGPVFLDWAETYLGHPFLTAEHLLADLARSNPFFAQKQSALRTFYAEHWKPYLRLGELERVTLFAPAVAALAYALIAWDTCRLWPNRRSVWPFLRSMLRRTKQELEKATGAYA